MNLVKPIAAIVQSFTKAWRYIMVWMQDLAGAHLFLPLQSQTPSSQLFPASWQGSALYLLWQAACQRSPGNALRFSSAVVWKRS